MDLSLYKGPKASNLGPEAAVLKGCKHLLRMLETQGRLAFVRVNVTPIPNGKSFRPNPDMAGCPDLIVWVAGGAVLCIEVKSHVGRLSDEQKRFQYRIERVAHRYHVVRSVDDLVRVLADNGVTLAVKIT